MTQPQLPPSQEQEEKLYSMAQAVRACGLPSNFRCRQLPAILKAFEHCPTPLRIEGDRDWRYTEFAISVFSEFAGFRKLGRSGEWLKRKAAEYAQSTAQDLQTIATESAQSCNSVEWELVTDPMDSIVLLEDLGLRQIDRLDAAQSKAMQLTTSNQTSLDRLVTAIQEADRRAAKLKEEQAKIDEELFRAETIARVVRKKLIQQEVEQALGI